MRHDIWGLFMKVIGILTILIFLQSCEAPTRNRVYQSTSTATTSTTEDDEDTSTTTTTTESTVVSGTGFSSCDLSYNYYNSSIGYFGLCQSSTTDTLFKVKMALSDSTIGTCFIPIYQGSSGDIEKVGTEECVNNVSETVYTVSFTRETSSTITAIMVVKANAMTSFNTAAAAKNKFITLNGGTTCSSLAYCSTAATNYSISVWNSFASIYGSYYVKVSL